MGRMRLLAAAVIVSILIVPGAAAGSGETLDDLVPAWAVRYTGQGDDHGSDLEVGDDGSVYVAAITETGSQEDLAVLKYDSDGELLWQRLLDLPANRGLIELDAAGNLYVASTFQDEGPPAGRLIAIAKLSSTGDELWRRITFPTLDPAFLLTGLEVDRFGRVYVLGYGENSVIYAYDADGEYAWETWIGGRMVDLSLDIGGSIYVTGSVFGGLPPDWTVSWQVVTAKYDSTGGEIWKAWYDHEDDTDIGRALVADDSGNVYVSGTSLAGDGVIKYDSDGNLLWTAAYDGTGWQEALSIVVDEIGDVYVTGNSRLTPTSSYHCLTVKYHGLTGETSWEARYEAAGGEDLCVDIRLDEVGRVYIVSASVGDGNRDYATVIYDPVSGSQLWEGRYDGPVSGADWPADIEVDSDGSVYVTGSSAGDNGCDVATVKYALNRPPSSDPNGPYLGEADAGIGFDGTGSADPEGDPLTHDWEWGDGTSAEDAGATPNHSYVEAGVYDVCLTVTDPHGAGDTACALVVIYDPSAGFVTGGGWVDSPLDAYVSDPSLTGKATFEFVSRYRKGATVPTGSTEFQFEAGDLSFHSDSFDWLVVTGSDYAKFRGTGTINGTGEFKFMIWAGDDATDTFRIKIWEEDEAGNETVIYDNGMDQEIGGGSIVIHTGK